MWSVGATFLELLNGQEKLQRRWNKDGEVDPIWKNEKLPVEIRRRLKLETEDKELLSPLRFKRSDSTISFLDQILESDPKKRPSVEE